jgi:hypothetical protein
VIIVMARAHAGRLYLFLEEDPVESDLWNVLAGRDLSSAELARFVEKMGNT